MAGQRRLLQELGFTTDLKDLGWFKYNAHFPNDLSEHEIDHVLVGNVPSDIQISSNPEEVNAYRWISIEALRAEFAAQPEQFTPWMMQAMEIAVKDLPR